MERALVTFIFLAMCMYVCTAQVIIKVSANSEGDVVLTCMVDGAFQKSVQWSTNRTGSTVNIAGGDDFTNLEVLSNNTLILRASSASYHGYYFCTHPMSGRNHTANIVTAPPLQINRIPLGNGDLLLTCLVNESTTIPVTWTFTRRRENTSNNLLGGDDDAHVQVLINNTVIVRDFSAEDVGQYRCSVRHDGFIRNVTANVSLAVRRDILTFTTYQDENFHFFITCNVNGAPATPSREITWSYTDLEDSEDEMLEMIPTGDEGSHLQVLENSTLLIRNYSPDDAGRYYCNTLLDNGTRKLKRIDVGGAHLSTVANVWLIALVTIFTILRNASSL